MTINLVDMLVHQRTSLRKSVKLECYLNVQKTLRFIETLANIPNKELGANKSMLVIKEVCTQLEPKE